MYLLCYIYLCDIHLAVVVLFDPVMVANAWSRNNYGGEMI